MERHFDEDIKHLCKGLIEMGSSVEEMISKSIKALKDRDIDFAKQVIEYDKVIDNMEIKLDDECFKLLALFQPVAEDLRYITTGMKIINDLERMADIAVNIVEYAIDLAREPLLKPLVDIPKMASLAQGMLRDILRAFVNNDVALAKEVWLREKESDKLRDLIEDELIEFIQKDGKCVVQALPLLSIARQLERICDLNTNIAEDIIFIATGKTARHHPEIFRQTSEKE